MGYMSYSIKLQLDKSRSKLLTYIADLENHGWSSQNADGSVFYKDKNDDWQHEKSDLVLFKSKIASFVADNTFNNIAFDMYYKHTIVSVSCSDETCIDLSCFGDRMERQSNLHQSMPIFDAAWHFENLIMPIYRAHELSYIGYEISQNCLV